MTIYSNYVENLKQSFIGIQRLYKSEYGFGRQPEILVNELGKSLLGKIDENTGFILFEIAEIEQNLLDQGSLIIVVNPSFADLSRSHFTKDCDDGFRFTSSGRERSVIVTKDQLPILNIKVVHQIKNEALCKKIQRATDLANQFFYESNLSSFERILELSKFLGIST